MNLLLSEKLWLEIDYYPKCGGILLDIGKVDKIIERLADGEDSFGNKERNTNNN
jgi:Zn-finger nucleic acid-binding protein